ncbi:hypothetical protein J4437_05020 [Candidatus Woesearchaeota archaeon]|nr:hypothetical protein [Candidatus Woesearchaeota archaeon]
MKYALNRNKSGMNDVAREIDGGQPQAERAVPYDSITVTYEVGDSLESSSKPRRRMVVSGEEQLDLVDLMER